MPPYSLSPSPTLPDDRPTERRACAPLADRRLRRVAILGTGACVPERVLANQDLERIVETSNEWIVTRTGMRERRIAGQHEATSDLAAEAGRRALQASDLAADQLEFIVVATVTPDEICPPTACHVQAQLGAHRAAGFDLSAACSGFMNALTTAHHLVAAGSYRNALVIGADLLSSITDYTDRETCVLFGDGAGAVVIGEQLTGGQLLDHTLGIDGRGADLIKVPAGGSRRPTSSETIRQREHYLTLQGRKVFKFAVQKMVEVVTDIAKRNDISVDDINLLVPHQANLRILEAAGARLGIGCDRMVINVDRFGNTSSASVPIALDEAARTGRLSRGDLVCLVAFGGGLSWGATLLRW